MFDDPLAGSDGGADTIFRDVVFLALTGFIAIVLLLLPHLNPRGEQQEKADDPPGNVIVELFWNNERDVDVDLWVQAPRDVPVGYSNRGGIFFNLLRDDLGNYKDATPINYEVAYSRGISAGEHAVNVHLYRRDAPSQGPLDAKVVVTVADPETKLRTQILETKFEIENEGEEKTVFRFDLTDEGELVPGSVNNVFKELRGKIVTTK